jgi:tRNA threonylcarbamoyladenosine biosynthesis protein TsaE
MDCQEHVVSTKSPEQTRELGRLVGAFLDGPARIGLKGELGCGKTLFIQGLARGLSVPERFAVTSPTYTLINEYPGRMPLFHVDLYRIADPEELEDIGLEEAAGGKGVAAIEWPDRLPEGSFDLDMAVSIEMTGDRSRTLRFLFYGRRFHNLLQELKKLQFP